MDRYLFFSAEAESPQGIILWKCGILLRWPSMQFTSHPNTEINWTIFALSLFAPRSSYYRYNKLKLAERPTGKIQVIGKKRGDI